MASQPAWYYADATESVGPMSLDELVARLPDLQGTSTLVYGPGTADWIEARHVSAVVDALGGRSGPPPPPSGRRADEIDYEIFGEEMQYVEITLDPNEMVVAEAGSMMYMTPGIEMETVFGDPSIPHGGFLGKVMSAGKRLLTGESLVSDDLLCWGREP